MACSLSVAAQESANAPATQAGPDWLVVQPVLSRNLPLPVLQAISEGLQRELGQTVALHAPTYGKGADAIVWSLQAAPGQPSVLIFPEEISQIGKRSVQPAHLSHFVPLLVVAMRSWCMLTRQDSELQTPEQLVSRAREQQRPVHIGLPMSGGRLGLWVKGMALLTRHAWNMQEYGFHGDFGQLLAQGTDVVLAPCAFASEDEGRYRVLALGGESDPEQYPGIPSFEQLKWMPMGPSWIALMVPQSIAPEHRARMAQALYRVTRTAAAQAHMRAAGLIPQDMTPEASTQYMNRYIDAWEAVGTFLARRGFGNRRATGLPTPS